MVTARRATNRDFKIKLGSEGREEGEAGGAVPRGKRRRVYHEHQVGGGSSAWPPPRPRLGVLVECGRLLQRCLEPLLI